MATTRFNLKLTLKTLHGDVLQTIAVPFRARAPAVGSARLVLGAATMGRELMAEHTEYEVSL